MHFEGGKTSTRFLEQNIENLAYAHFEGVGEYDIPEMYPEYIENLADIPIQGFNFAIKEKHPEKIGVHFFLHDYQFERVWKYPDRYVDVLKKFAFVMSPDFSPYADMPRSLKIYNVYRNRWCGRFWQENGVRVIPTVTWSDDDSLKYCLDGVPKNGTIAVSSMGEGRWARWTQLKKAWPYVVGKLQPKQILLYGKDLSKELSGNIVYKRMISSKVAV